MGSLYLLTCPLCHYGEDIHEGVGMSAAIYEPMLCKVCRRIVPVETRPPNPDWLASQGADEEPTKPNRCPHCKGDELERWGRFGEHDEPQPGSCPTCGGTMQVESIGMWD